MSTTPIRSRSARAIADVTVGTIFATVDIAAPPERVFKALTTEEVANWWGAPGMYRTTGYTADLRPGGKWKSVGKGEDGHEFHVEGEILEVDAPRKLVQTWMPSWDPGDATTITYRLEAIEGGTRLTLRHEGFSAARAQSCSSHADGWERVLGWLNGFASPKDEPKKAFLLRLLPPRATFALDMTPTERETMGQHAAYWAQNLAKGTVIAFGPVMDPKGGWGVGLVEVKDEAEVEALEKNDPAITKGLGLRYERLPMPVLRR